MIHVDMGAITETLFESELFGHVKGALPMQGLIVPESLKRLITDRYFWTR